MSSVGPAARRGRWFVCNSIRGVPVAAAAARAAPRTAAQLFGMFGFPLISIVGSGQQVTASLYTCPVVLPG